MSWTRADEERRKLEQTATRLQRAVSELETATRQAAVAGLTLELADAYSSIDRALWKAREARQVRGYRFGAAGVTKKDR